MLPHTVTITPFTGQTALGETYGAEYTTRCRVEIGQTLIKDTEGKEIVGNGRVFLPADIQILSQSKLEHGGDKYTVVGVKKVAGLRSPAYIRAVIL